MRRLPHTFDRAGKMGSFFTIPLNQEVLPDLSATLLLGELQGNAEVGYLEDLPNLGEVFSA